jgi:hypothetical protein
MRLLAVRSTLRCYTPRAMDVAKHPGLMRRGARYYIRVRIPLDLVETIGRSEIWKSLGTADHREAVRRYFPARTELHKAFDQARRRRDANVASPCD